LDSIKHTELIFADVEFAWKIKENPEQKLVETLALDLGVSHVISKLLIQRGIHTFEEARHFFRPQLADLHDPFLMKDMDKAVKRLCNAIKNKESICVYGDYDVDGTTSVAMMSDFLRQQFHLEVSTYIPDRYKEGYGLSSQFIESLAAEKYDLVITLDCGITAVDMVSKGNKFGVDFIICDHHKPKSILPPAYAVLDPVRADCIYPFKGLSGCGVGFKLIQGVLSTLNKDPELAFSYLDLLTISIGADIVPMDGENRILAEFGLQLINKEPRPGIRAMLKSSKKLGSEITNGDVVFAIAPRINAAGRIGHAKSALDLLLAESLKKGEELCKPVEDYNSERKTVDKEITSEALHKLDQDEFYKDSRSTVVWGNGWHKGVIGIVASRIIENHYKPTVVLTEHEGMATGSARSIKGFDIHEALEEIQELFIKFGGHKMAAGLSLSSENLIEFRKRFDEVVKKKLGVNPITPEIIIDSEVDFTEINQKFYRILQQFAPFGPKNMTPLFVTRNAVDAGYSKAVGEEKTHLKLSVVQKNSGARFFSGIAFKMGHLIDKIKAGTPFDVVYSVELNEWQGRKSLQLNVRDIKFTDD